MNAIDNYKMNPNITPKGVPENLQLGRLPAAWIEYSDGRIKVLSYIDEYERQYRSDSDRYIKEKTQEEEKRKQYEIFGIIIPCTAIILIIAILRLKEVLT